MTVTNDPTGRVSTCTRCGAHVEEALLMRGLIQPVRLPSGNVVRRPSPGVPVWRTLDRGHGSARCPLDVTGLHQPGTITGTRKTS